MISTELRYIKALVQGPSHNKCLVRNKHILFLSYQMRLIMIKSSELFTAVNQPVG